MESTPIAPICSRTGTDFARWDTSATCGAGVNADSVVGQTEGATVLGTETDRAPPATVSLEKTTVPMAIVANKAATIAVTDQRARRGPFPAERGRNRLPCSDVQTTPTYGDNGRATDPSEHQHTGQQA